MTDGGNGTWNGSPSRTSTAQYSYAFAGWSRYEDQTTADPTATKSVAADRSVYAAYTATLRTYTITWQNADNTTLETDENVPYGTMPTFDGATPTYQGETSTGWQPTVAAVTGNQTYKALYIPVYRCRFYNGSTLLETVNVQEGGTAVYSGATPEHGTAGFEFDGWDKPLTNITAATDFYAQFKDMRSPVIQYVEGTMTDYFSDTATAVATHAFQNVTTLETVETSATSIGPSAFASCKKLATVDLTGAGAVTIAGGAFSSTKLDALIIRSSTMATLANANALLGTKIATGFGAVYVPSSLVSTYKADSLWSAYIIASIDDYPLTDLSTISDSWTTIISKAQGGTAAQSYSVGDTKLLDLGTEGKTYMEVATVSENGITFIALTALATKKRMNPSNQSGAQGTGANGGWEYSEMREYLNEDVFALLPAELQSAIKAETKYSSSVVPGESTKTVDGCVTQDKLWLLSNHELTGTTTYETQGTQYETFNSQSKKIRYDQTIKPTVWFLRSADNINTFGGVRENGSMSGYSAYDEKSVIFGFSL